MTEKRFTAYIGTGYDVSIFYDNTKGNTESECELDDEEILELLNNLHEENELLKEALKKEYMSMSGVLCDACKHQEATYTNNWFVGEDFDVKCNKGHEVLIDDDEQECGDFELRIGDVE